VVSSPAFADAYFRTRTPYRGPIFLLENKVCMPLDGFAPAVLEAARQGPADGEVLHVGVVGRLRCSRSLELLGAVLGRCRRRLRVHVFGYPEANAETAFQALLAHGDAVVWHGRFAYPEDLPKVYGQLHLNWCVVFDELQPLNGRWLLPNRIYEGGLFAVPAIALAGTETGRWIEGIGGGWLLHDEGVEPLVALLDGLAPDDLGAARARLQATPRRRFVDGYADHAEALARVAPVPAPTPASVGVEPGQGW
jgi:succinoglycan biosynthesis protein ExoL